MCNKCCGCLKGFFCLCCRCCNRKKKNNGVENDGRKNKKVISTISEIVVDSDNESVYNGSSTYEVPVSSRENAKSISVSLFSGQIILSQFSNF